MARQQQLDMMQWFEAQTTYLESAEGFAYLLRCVMRLNRPIPT